MFIFKKFFEMEFVFVFRYGSGIELFLLLSVFFCYILVGVLVLGIIDNVDVCCFFVFIVFKGKLSVYFLMSLCGEIDFLRNLV